MPRLWFFYNVHQGKNVFSALARMNFQSNAFVVFIKTTVEKPLNANLPKLFSQ